MALIGCEEKYSCANTGIATIPQGYSFSPFVELKIGNEYLTVGNNSRPNGNNTAVISSLNYGTSDGQGCTIEIEDEEGGSFAESFNRLNKSLAGMSDNTLYYELDFGWIIEDNCGGEFNTKKLAVSNAVKNTIYDKIYLLPLSMKVTYEGNKIKYILEAQDMMARVGEARVECNFGTDDKKMTLKQAIRLLFAEREPAPKCDVEFLSADGKGEFKFKASDGGDSSGEGPKSVWSSSQQNKLATARRWISSLVTTNEKGIIMQWKGGKPEGDIGGTLIFQEDPNQDFCSNNYDPCKANISTELGIPGTYVVNGGKTSAVISFNPTVNWTLVNSGKTGGGQSSVDGGGVKQEGKKECKDDIDKGGSNTATFTNTGASNYRSPDQQFKKDSDANTAHQKANSFREVYGPIEAELKIFGNPALVFPHLLVGRSLSLIVVNPFHLRPSLGDCPDWLAQPVCNPVFSNKNWMIRGVNHQISKGSYVTIINIFLPVPGVHFNPDVEVGGRRSGGQKLEIKTQPDAKKC